MSHPWQFYRTFEQNKLDFATSKHIVTIGFFVNYWKILELSKHSVTFSPFVRFVGTRKSFGNSETKGLLKVCGNEGLYLTKETKNANFLTSVYIFRLVEE